MAAIPSGADLLANELLENLLDGKTFYVPEVDLGLPEYQQPDKTGPIYGEIPRITVDDLTTGQVGGTGIFDKLMVSLVNHLKVEYTANRISGAEYTKAYIGVVGAALQTAQQFLLTKDQAYWQALLVQAQAKAADVVAVQARVELETAKVQLTRIQYEAATAEAAYGLTKIKISNEDATYANMIKQGTSLDFQNTSLNPQQLNMLKEQTEAARAQTMDIRTDGITITGSVGKQKALYDQQITSYQRDSEQKAAKLWTDAWITMKTIDEGLLPPGQFSNANLDALLSALRSKLNLG